MALAKTEEEWGQRASAFLKVKMKEADVTYAELVKRLKKHGLQGNRSRNHNEAETGDVFRNVLSSLYCGAGTRTGGIGGNLRGYFCSVPANSPRCSSLGYLKIGVMKSNFVSDRIF